MLYTLAAWCTVILAVAFAIFKARHRLPQGVRRRVGMGDSNGGSGTGSSVEYSRLPAFDWTASRLAGLHSTLFDIESNVREGDGRAGLEGGGAAEIQRLMRTQNVDFDTARLMLNQARFSKNNIDPRTGMPLDSKAVTFENLR